MEKLPWLGLLMFTTTISGKGVLDLSGKQVVNGTWKAPVTLPCVYEPSADFKELSVAWKTSLQDHGLRTIFHRDESSGDQVLLTVFKGRLSVQTQPPGDVSLQIKALDMTDTGTYTCSVSWEARNKSRINKERVVTLRVVKVPVTKPVIKSSNGASPILPEGARTSLTCVAHGSPPIRYQWFKEEAGSNDQLVSNEAVLTFDHLKTSDTGSYYCVVRNRVRTQTEQSDSVQLTVEKGSTPLSTLHPSIKPEVHTTSGQETTTTTVGEKFKARTAAAPTVPRRATTTGKAAGTTSSAFGSRGNGSERQGHRKTALPLYIIILIAVLCAVLVLVILSVAFCRRRTKPNHTYQFTYNNNSMNVTAEGERPGVDSELCNGTYEQPNFSVDNNYTVEPTKGSEYVVMGTKPENDYELLVNKMESEYEATNVI